MGCNILPISVEAHWSLISELYNGPIISVTKTLLVDHHQAPLSLVIDYAILAMSHTVGPKGFNPVILAFGAQPLLPIRNYEQLPQVSINRMDLTQISRREYEPIVAKLRIRHDLHSASPN